MGQQQTIRGRRSLAAFAIAYVLVACAMLVVGHYLCGRAKVVYPKAGDLSAAYSFVYVPWLVSAYFVLLGASFLLSAALLLARVRFGPKLSLIALVFALPSPAVVWAAHLVPLTMKVLAFETHKLNVIFLHRLASSLIAIVPLALLLRAHLLYFFSATRRRLST